MRIRKSKNISKSQLKGTNPGKKTVRNKDKENEKKDPGEVRGPLLPLMQRLAHHRLEISLKQDERSLKVSKKNSNGKEKRWQINSLIHRKPGKIDLEE